MIFQLFISKYFQLQLNICIILKIRNISNFLHIVVVKLTSSLQIYELTHKGESLPRPITSSLLTTLYYMLGYPADLQVNIAGIPC